MQLAKRTASNLITVSTGTNRESRKGFSRGNVGSLVRTPQRGLGQPYLEHIKAKPHQHQCTTDKYTTETMQSRISLLSRHTIHARRWLAVDNGCSLGCPAVFNEGTCEGWNSGWQLGMMPGQGHWPVVCDRYWWHGWKQLVAERSEDNCAREPEIQITPLMPVYQV